MHSHKLGQCLIRDMLSVPRLAGKMRQQLRTAPLRVKDRIQRASWKYALMRPIRINALGAKEGIQRRGKGADKLECSDGDLPRRLLATGKLHL